MNTVDVLLTGRLLPGSDANRAAAALAQMTGLPQDKALALLTGGKPKLAKRGLTPEEAQVFVDRFAELGIETSLRPGTERGVKPAAAPPPPPQAAEPPPAPEPTPAAPEPAPEPAPAPTPEPEAPPVAFAPEPEPAPEPAPAPPEAESAADDAAMSVAAEQAAETAAPLGETAAEPEEAVNPYAPPKADLTRPREHEGHGRWSDEPAEAPAMRGFEWYREAWGLFRAWPRIWVGPLAVVTLLYFIVLLLPKGSGGAVLGLLLPVLAGGVAMTAHRLVELEAAREGEDTPIAPHGPNPYADPKTVRRLVNFSLCCALYQLAAGLVLFVCLLGLSALGSFGRLLALLLLVPLFAPQYLFSLFGPSLVALGGMGALAAMRACLRGGIKNWQPILLNALVMAIVAMLGLTLVMLIAGGAGLTGLGGAAVGSLLTTLFFAPLWGLFALTSYFAASEVFYEEDH